MRKQNQPKNEFNQLTEREYIDKVKSLENCLKEMINTFDDVQKCHSQLPYYLSVKLNRACFKAKRLLKNDVHVPPHIEHSLELYNYWVKFLESSSSEISYDEQMSNKSKILNCVKKIILKEESTDVK